MSKDSGKIRNLLAWLSAILWTSLLVARVIIAIWEHGFTPVDGWVYTITTFLLVLYLWLDVSRIEK